VFEDAIHGEQFGAFSEAPLVEVFVVFANEEMRHRVSDESTEYHATLFS